ncbi:MAG: hypothetical protein ACLU38_03265 [Dysosmobacter sp.]
MEQQAAALNAELDTPCWTQAQTASEQAGERRTQRAELRDGGHRHCRCRQTPVRRPPPSGRRAEQIQDPAAWRHG